MGTLPPDQAGAGSAVNDTVREVGGTLGVAVVGSVMSTIYGPHVVDALTSLGVQSSTAHPAASSIVSGMNVATALPGDAVGPAVAAVRDAFVDGLAAGSYVAAAACAVAAIAALAFLPARARSAH
jgi:hypothetical protein